MRTSTEIENIKKYQTEFIELKNIIIELKNSIVKFNSRLNQAEEMINKLDRAGDFIQSDEKGGKKMKTD